MPVVIHLQAGLPEVAEFMNTELSHVMHDEYTLVLISLYWLVFPTISISKLFPLVTQSSTREVERSVVPTVVKNAKLSFYKLVVWRFTIWRSPSLISSAFKSMINRRWMISSHIDDLDKWGWNCAFNSQLDHNSIKACAREEREVSYLILRTIL